MLGDNKTYREIGEVLVLTQPAICHRTKKYREIWPEFSITMQGTKRVISEKTKELCKTAQKVLEALNEYEMEVSGLHHSDDDAMGIAVAG
jgi:hypothetical protein